MADIKKEHEQNFLNEIRNLTKEATDALYQQHLTDVNDERRVLKLKLAQAAKAGNYEVNIQNMYEENINFFNENGFFIFLSRGSPFNIFSDTLNSRNSSYIISWRNYKEKFSFPPTTYDEKRVADALIKAEENIRKTDFAYIRLPQEEGFSTWLRKNGYIFSYDNRENEYKVQLQKDTGNIEGALNNVLN